MTRLVLGGYGTSLGLVDFGDEGFGEPRAVGQAVNPSWVVASDDGRFVYAALESEEGHVGAWAVTPDLPWRALGEQPTGGADPCHLALSSDGRWLLAANYSSGSVSVHPVRDDGSLGTRTHLVQHAGVPGPVEDRQDGPHAHEVVFGPDGTVLVCDLGLDVVIGYALDVQDGRLTEVSRSPFPPGTGPRHLVVGSDGRTAYVVGELASTLSVCRLYGPRLEVLSTVSARAEGAEGENTAAEVLLTADGTTVLVSHRGDDTVTTLAVDAENARLVSVDPCGGTGPRWIGFASGEQTLLVANERSDEVVTMRRNRAGWTPVGSLGWTRPTCVATLTPASAVT